MGDLLEAGLHLITLLGAGSFGDGGLVKRPEHVAGGCDGGGLPLELELVPLRLRRLQFLCEVVVRVTELL